MPWPWYFLAIETTRRRLELIIRSFASLSPLSMQLGELHLLGGGQQLVAAGLVEEELERVRRGDGEVAVDVRAADCVRAGAVVGERDVPFLELLEEAGGLLVVEIGFLEELADRGEVEAAELLSLLQQDL